jgi:hypothetical protein
MSTLRQASLPTLPAPDPATKGAPCQLRLDAARGVRVILERGDLAAVEAAAAEMKVRFGSRFAVTARRLSADRTALRISAGLIASVNTAMDAEGVRQWAFPEASGANAGGESSQGT